jgi:hypothetical protein
MTDPNTLLPAAADPPGDASVGLDEVLVPIQQRPKSHDSGYVPAHDGS